MIRQLISLTFVISLIISCCSWFVQYFSLFIWLYHVFCVTSSVFCMFAEITRQWRLNHIFSINSCFLLFYIYFVGMSCFVVFLLIFNSERMFCWIQHVFVSSWLVFPVPVPFHHMSSNMDRALSGTGRLNTGVPGCIPGGSGGGLPDML